MKNIYLKNKIINHLTLNGNKETNEKNFNRNFKELQKKSLKKTKELIQLAVIKSSSIFKLNIIKRKKKKKKFIKEIPTFISSKNRRTSFAIKLILSTLKKEKQQKNNTFSKEILTILQNTSETLNKKNSLQKQILKNKRYFLFYKWKKHKYTKKKQIKKK